MNDTPLLKNLSGLRNFSEWVTPETLEKGVALLKRPAAIAIIASVGLHGLLGISLPIWSGSSKEADPKKVVKLVDLTPAEQSRLPQAPGVVSPALQVPSSSPILGSSPGLGSFGKSLFQPLPDSTFNLSSPKLNTTPPGATNRPFVISPDLFLKPLPNLTIKYPDSPPLASPPPTSPPPAPVTPSPLQGATPSPSPAPTTSPVPVDPVRAAEDQKARMIAGFRLDQQLQAAGATSTSREDQLTRYTAWQESIVQTGKATLEELAQNVISRPISLTCPAEDCTDKLVTFTVVVDANGRLLGDPGLIVKTGDVGLDKAAEQEFHKLLPELQKPPEKNRVTVYLIQVDFTGQKVG